ncbi:MAG: FHA domain-containing protein [Lachnospiraceae bacterium]|nr:FHA domain-containing protein [Lachnospiraceae bacterium]
MVIKGVSGNFAGKEFQIRGSVSFGRNPQECDVLFPDGTRGVSRSHCKLDSAGSGLTLTDMGSSYGTFLNGRKLSPYTPSPLNPGDTFYLGDKSNTFTVSGAAGNANPANPAAGASQGIDRKKIIIAAAAAVLVLAAILIVIGVRNARNNNIVGTWKVAEKPGERVTFAENGDLLFTTNGEYERDGGAWTYSPAGDHMISVKYTGPTQVTTIDGGMDLWFFNAGGTYTEESAYSKGAIWKYKYDSKTKSIIVYDVNDYKLFSLEK